LPSRPSCNLGGAVLFGYRPDLIGWALAAVASLLPDVDLPTSKVGRLCGFVSVLLERRFGHRTLAHSAVAWRCPAASIEAARITCWAGWSWPMSQKPVRMSRNETLRNHVRAGRSGLSMICRVT